MSLAADIRSSALTGSLALLKGDPAAMRHFDVSVTGFWRSFLVALLLAPTLVVDIAADRRFAEAVGLAEPTWAPRVLLYLAGFAVFPAVLALLARPLALQRVFVPFIIARNWTTVLGMVPMVVAGLAFAGGFIDRSLYLFASDASLGFNLFFAYRVARIGAAAPPSLAAGLVALDLVLVLLMGAAVARLA
jgi:hypothetical protein